MKKLFKKSIAFFLILAMVVGAAPMAFAENKSIVQETGVGSEVSTTSPLSVFTEGLTQTGADFNDSYYVSGIVFNDNVATVSYNAISKCTLVVAVYDEITLQLITSGKVVVDKDENEIQVSMEEKTLPQKFVAKGFLLDDNFAALSKEYICNLYTSKYEEFLKTVPSDFPGEVIVDMDEDKTEESFAVLASNVISCTGDSSMSYEYDENSKTYTFINPTEETKNLSKGDIFYYETGSDVGEFIIFKVWSVSQKGNMIVITEDDEISLDEAFLFVKFNEEADFSNVEVDESQLGSALSLDESVNTQGELSTQAEIIDSEKKTTKTTQFNFSWPSEKDSDEETKKALEKGWSFKGSLGYTVTASVKLFYDARIGKDYYEYETKLDHEIKLKGSFSGEIKLNKNKFKFSFPEIPIGGIFTLNMKVYLIGELSGTIDLISITFIINNKVTYSNTNGLVKENVEKKKFDDDLGIGETEIVVKFGVGFEAKFGFSKGKEDKDGKKTIDISLQLNVDVSFIKVTLKPHAVGVWLDKLHQCVFCLEGSLSSEIEGTLTLNFKVTKHLNTSWDAVKIGYEKAWGKCYISISGKNSHIVKIGLGECPNILYEVNVKVVLKDEENQKENVVDGAVVASPTGKCDVQGDKKYDDDEILTNSSGIATFYFKPGNHTVTVSYEDYDAITKPITVIATKQDITVTFVKEKEDAPDNPGGSVGNVSWNYNSATKTLTLTGSGNMTDYASLTSAPWHQYYEEAEKIVVESGITSIGDYAFAQFRNVSEIELPSTLTKIGMCAFYGCNNIQSITIGDNVKSIGDYAFFACQSARSIYIGSSVETIGKYAFAQCQAVSVINVPASVTSVGASAFKHCTNLNAITFMNSSCKIGDTEDTIFYGATIYGGSSSTAKSYASKYSRSFVAISTAKVATLSTEASGLSTQGIGAGYYAKTSGAYEGEEYVLVVVKKSANGIVLDNDSLLYIDQKTADANGEISFAFIPRTDDSCVAYIIGKFSDTTQKQVEHQSAAKPVSLVINTLPSKTSYIYKEGSIDLSGIVVTAVYYDGSTEIVEVGDINVDGFDTSSTGTKSVTIEYKDASASYDIKVSYAWWQWLIRIFLLGIIWY